MSPESTSRRHDGERHLSAEDIDGEASGPQGLPDPASPEQHYRAAAARALRRYPGPVGELIHRELCAYAAFGHRFATDALIPHLMTSMLTRPPCTPGRTRPNM